MLASTPIPKPTMSKSAGTNGLGMEIQHKASLTKWQFFSTALSEKDVNGIMNKGLAVALSVSPKEKLTTIWGSLKTIRYLGN